MHKKSKKSTLTKRSKKNEKETIAELKEKIKYQKEALNKIIKTYLK